MLNVSGKIFLSCHGMKMIYNANYGVTKNVNKISMVSNLGLQ